MKKISLDKVLNKVWNKFYEEKQEDNIETKEIKKDLALGKDSKVILDPFAFLEKYTIEPLSTISVELSYNLSPVQNKKEEFTSDGQIGIEKNNNNISIANQATIVEENVIAFLKKFKKRAIEFANEGNTPETFAVSFNWILKNNPAENYRLTISVANQNGKLQIKDVSQYSIAEDRNPKPIMPISKFIKDNKKYIKNSPFRLLASILVYNDWKYNWDIDTMQLKQNLDKRLILK